MELDRARALRGALAGTIAAGAWAAQQPLDKRAFALRYDDVELLGRAVTRGRGWYPIGLALHLGNGALFGAVFATFAPGLAIPQRARGPIAGLAEHLASWPLVHLSDRVHPDRARLPALGGSRRAFVQASWRHLLFGAVLGELERRLNRPRRTFRPA
jgi:hypothetical protein